MNKHEQLQFDAWLDNQEQITPSEVEKAWAAWQESRRQTIAWIQQASKEPVALPGAIVLPGDFFQRK